MACLNQVKHWMSSSEPTSHVSHEGFHHWWNIGGFHLIWSCQSAPAAQISYQWTCSRDVVRSQNVMRMPLMLWEAKMSCECSKWIFAAGNVSTWSCAAGTQDVRVACCLLAISFFPHVQVGSLACAFWISNAWGRTCIEDILGWGRWKHRHTHSHIHVIDVCLFKVSC